MEPSGGGEDRRVLGDGGRQVPANEPRTSSEARRASSDGEPGS